MVSRNDPRLLIRPVRQVTANRFLLDRAVGHAVLLERLKQSESNRILRFLDRQVLPDLRDKLTSRLANIRTRGFDTGFTTTQRLRELGVAIDATISEGMRLLHGETRDGLFDLAKAEGAVQAGFLSEAIAPVGLSTTTPSASRLRSIVTSRPFQGRNLREWYQKQSQATRDLVRQQVQVGLAQGETSEMIVRRVFAQGGIGQTRNGVRSIVRTAINHVAAHARDATYRENRDIVKGWHFVATLDARTTEKCAFYDSQRGKDGLKLVHPIGGGPKPPTHWNCRSADAPVLYSLEELGLDGKDFPPGTRASMDGQVPQTVTFEEWIRDQSFERQRAVFGVQKARAFRAGRITVEDMVDEFGNPLTLEQIVAREGPVFVGLAG